MNEQTNKQINKAQTPHQNLQVIVNIIKQSLYIKILIFKRVMFFKENKLIQNKNKHINLEINNDNKNDNKQINT